MYLLSQNSSASDT